jgi:subfamily B ATP-binding cassette protein MsbA
MNVVKRLFPYIRPYLPLLILAVLLLVGSGFLEALIIMMLAPIFNQLTPSVAANAAGGDKFEFLQQMLGLEGEGYAVRVAIYLVLFSLVKGLFLYLAEYSMSRSGQCVVATIRRHLFSHLMDQSLAFFARNPTGKLMARIVTDTERLQETVSRTVTDFVRQIFLLVFFLGVVLYTDWKLSLLSFAIAPLVLTITLRLGQKIRRHSWRSQENLSEISHALQESISGQKVVKAFGMEDHERGRFNRLVDRLVRVNLKVVRVGALGSPLIEFIGYVAFVPFLFYANYQVSRGFTIGAFVVFVAALFRLYEPVRKLSRMHLHFQQAAASASRVFDLMDTRIEMPQRPDAVALPTLSSEIVFDNVEFAYPGDDSVPVLQDIDLTIRKGEIVALVGSSGAGKTSLVNLLPRFYDVDGGEIRIDGRDIRSCTISSLREQIAIVTQETFLFDETIKSNIAYGREDCKLEDVVEAARAAYIHSFIEALPDQYETLIGERGQRLSGGQQQRIAIARAILKKAPILILDEATSALDTESERLIQKALHNLMQHCTTIVIAHRLSTVRLAHRIAVLDRGRLVEIGSHVELMRKSGVYRKLYELQFADLTLSRD